MSETNEVTEGDVVAYVCAAKICQLVMHKVKDAVDSVDRGGLNDTQREFADSMSEMMRQFDSIVGEGTRLVDALMNEVKFYREVESI